MSADEGHHHYTFGAPTKGWPTFDENGKLVPSEKSRRSTKKLLDDMAATLEEYGQTPSEETLREIATRRAKKA